MANKELYIVDCFGRAIQYTFGSLIFSEPQALRGCELGCLRGFGAI